MLLEGLFLPLTTPFHPDGRFHPRKLEANVARYSKTPAAGMILLGASGEPTLLSDLETREVLEAAMRMASPEKVMVAGISRDSVSSTLALAERAAELHYDAILVGLPTIFAASPDRALLEIRTYFQCVADRAPLPVILESRQQDHRPLLAPELIAELAHHPNVIGLWEDTTAPARTANIVAQTRDRRQPVTVTSTFAAVTGRMKTAASPLASAAMLSGGGTAVAAPVSASNGIKTRSKTVGFQVIAGNAAAMLESLRNGAVGVAPAFAACAPQACYEVVAAWKDGDAALAEEKQARLATAAEYVEKHLGVGGLKLACDRNGYFGGRPRLPLLPPSGEQASRLEDVMHDLHH